MKPVKFILVKLIIRTLGIFCLILMISSQLFSFPADSNGTLIDSESKSDFSLSDINNLGDNNRFEQSDTINSSPLNKEEEKSIRKSKRNIKDAGGFFMSLFLDDSEILAVKNRFIDFGESFVPESNQPFYFALVEFAFEYPFILVLFISILFFILNIIVVVVVLDNTIREKNKRLRYKTIYSAIYEKVLLSYIFEEKEWDSILLQLKNINRKENKKILIEILFNFQENLKGDVGKRIPEIYTKLGLQNDALKATKSFRYHKKAKAIKELTNLYPEGAVKIISTLINDPNDKIRAEVQTAYIRLNQDHPFEFLKFLTKPFAHWTQLSAFNLIRLYQIPVPPFSKFLVSGQNTVRNFCLRMINYYQQLESVSVIFHLLESEIEQTRFLTYKAINDLRLYDGRLNIKKKYRGETGKNKLEIVKALRNIGNEEDLDFLEIILKSESVSLKTEACRSMYFMGEKGKKRVISLAKEFDPKLEQYIAHITDPRN